MYENVSKENYEFVWSVKGASYLMRSFALEEYRDRDFVVTSDGENQAMYIGREQRKILSEEGLELYSTKFADFKERVLNQIKLAGNFLAEQKDIDLKKLTNLELADALENLVLRNRNYFAGYFMTEFFCLDRVTEILEKKEDGFDLETLRKNVDEMGKLKYEWREVINKYAFPGGLFFRYFDEIEERLKLAKPLSNYHWREVVGMLRGEVVSAPNREVVIYGKFSGGKDIVGDLAKVIIDRLGGIVVTVREIKGAIGNKGIYRGVVKKIDFHIGKNYASEIESMKQGDVLVSGSTGPEMILACKKAGAIVTEEGGITSHAAVVSRELKIPCVIGTKIATKVLKDGMVVEVDADLGMVRIIEG